MTSAHYFIDISQNILNLWMMLIFPETRYMRLQFKYNNKTIPIIIKSNMIFRNWLYRLLQRYGKTKFWLTPHSHQSFYLMHQISLKAKMRSRFMILCQPSLNGLPFVFPQQLLYKPSLSFIPRHKKTPLFPSLEF